MSIIMLKNVTLAFPAIDVPQAIGEGAPAYGGKLIIHPTEQADLVKLLDAAILEVAREKWKDKAEDVINVLKEEKLICFHKTPYRSKKTGKVYDGFEGMYHVGTRSEKVKPTAVSLTGAEITDNAEIKRVFYSGCKVHAKIELWAQDNQFGRRINSNMLGLMFAGQGTRFGGGAAAASADEFASLAADAADLV